MGREGGRGLQRVCRQPRIYLPKLAVPSHVLEEAAVRPGGADEQAGERRHARRERDGEQDREHHAHAVRRRYVRPRLVQPALAPLLLDLSHRGDVIVGLRGDGVGVGGLGVGQRFEVAQRRLAVPVERLEGRRAVERVEVLYHVASRVPEGRDIDEPVADLDPRLALRRFRALKAGVGRRARACLRDGHGRSR